MKRRFTGMIDDWKGKAGKMYYSGISGVYFWRRNGKGAISQRETWRKL